MIQKLKNIYHLGKAVLANLYFGFPSKKLKVIGVTGTDGKTTTSSLIYHILKSNGKKVSMISTVYAKIGDKEFDTGLHTTTPDSWQVQGLLKKSVDAGDEYFVLETTSHALDQNRIWGVQFELALITNVTHEHLDYHKTYENYVKTKAKLLLAAHKTFVNRDDGSYELISTILHKAGKKYETYGLSKESDYSKDISKELGIELAHFNKYNYLVAYAISSTIGIKDNDIYKAMKTFPLPPGRMETIYDKDFKVIIDFAHTPNAIYEALQAMRAQLKKGGRLIHVFSSAGLRDQTKRPLMGKASGEFADIVILSEEDYRTEDPIKINNEIAKGLKEQGVQFVKPEELGKKKEKQYTVIINREEALKKALSIASKNDIVTATGKAHEQSLCRGKIEYPWNDIVGAKKILGIV